MPDYYEIRGFDELRQFIDQQPEIALPIGQRFVQQVASSFIGFMKIYPPSTAANDPGRLDRNGQPMGYYERGRGWWYPIKRAPNLGGIIGKSAGAIKVPKTLRANKLGIAGYKLARGRTGERGTSELLGRSWVAVTTITDTAIEARINNTASYSSYVEGTVNQQSQVMNAIGWPTVDDGLAQLDDAVNQASAQMLDALIKNFGGGT